MGFSRNEYLEGKNRKYFRAGKSKPDLNNLEIIIHAYDLKPLCLFQDMD
jgi:hypothetical protein